jgi:CRISPR-associated protein Csa5
MPDEVPRSAIDKLAQILAALVADGNYTYVDRLANAPSIDLALFYLREAIRDFHSLMRQGPKNAKVNELIKRIKEELKDDSSEKLGKALSEIYNYCDSDPKKVREVMSLIGAKALAISARYISEESSSSGTSVSIQQKE